MAQGQQTTYVNTLPQKRVVSDRIIMTDPMDIPLISAFGLNNESKFKFVNPPGKMYEWLEDTYSPLTSTLNVTNVTNDTTFTTPVVADATRFQPGDVLLIDAEYVWVSAVNLTTSALTVTRNYGGTQATHASTAAVAIVSRARLEGATATDSHNTEATTGYNYSFIMQKNIEVSRTDGRIQRYGIPNVGNYEIDKKMDELKIDLTRKPYYGQRKAGSASTPRDAGGLDTFITTNLTTVTGALTLKHIEDAFQSCWTNGGNPKLIVCGAWAKRKISSFFEGSVRTERSERAGGVEVTRIDSALGISADVLVDRYIPTTSLYLLDLDHIGFITIDEFFYEDLAKTKDTSIYGQIVGEYGLVVAAEKRHAKISGFSLTS